MKLKVVLYKAYMHVFHKTWLSKCRIWKTSWLELGSD